MTDIEVQYAIFLLASGRFHSCILTTVQLSLWPLPQENECLGCDCGCLSAGQSSPGCSFVYSGIRRLRLPSPLTTRLPEKH